MSCKADKDCPTLPGVGQLQCAAGVCIPSIPGMPDLCTTSKDCGANEQCLIAVCVPVECQTAADCAKDEACTFGACTPAGTQLPQPGQCTTDADCADGGTCLATACVPLPGGFPGGIDMCGAGGSCPKGKTCQFGLICL
jgi:hypothetical protein